MSGHQRGLLNRASRVSCSHFSGKSVAREAILWIPTSWRFGARRKAGKGLSLLSGVHSNLRDSRQRYLSVGKQDSSLLSVLDWDHKRRLRRGRRVDTYGSVGDGVPAVLPGIRSLTEMDSEREPDLEIYNLIRVNWLSAARLLTSCQLGSAEAPSWSVYSSGSATMCSFVHSLRSSRATFLYFLQMIVRRRGASATCKAGKRSSGTHRMNTSRRMSSGSIWTAERPF